MQSDNDIQPMTESVRLRRQWLIAAEPSATPDSWPRLELNRRYSLWHHPDTRIWCSSDNKNKRGLLLIGLAVSCEFSAAGVQEHLLSDPAIKDDEKKLTKVLRQLCGTYVLVRYTVDHLFLYTDPAGMMPVFYGEQGAASSPVLFRHLSRDKNLDRVYPFSEDNDWYPGSLCPYLGIKALLANHRLDLSNKTIRRFWPEKAPPERAIASGISRSCNLIRGYLESVAQSGRALVSLTGGRDSRVNLAGLHQSHDMVRFFTVRTTGVKPCDLNIPDKLSRRFALNHVFISDGSVQASPWIQDAYDEISSHMAVGGRRRVLGACAQFIGSDYIHVNGNLGAITKSFFWHSSRPSTVRQSSLAREFARQPTAIKAGVSEWLDSVPNLPAMMTYNLMYLEQRGGRWMAIGENASNLFYESFTPFCSRELFETICSLPSSDQYGGSLLTEFTRYLWPELLQVPYCPVTRQWTQFLPRSLKNYAKRIRTRFA